MVGEMEQLLFHEAYLLDSGQFSAWLDLLAPELRYWAPVRAEVDRERERADEGRRLALFDETKASLSLRVSRLATGLAWIENPTSRTRRFISNVMVDAEGDGVVRVRSNFMVFRSRSYVDETILVGCREDRWAGAGQWLLRERKIWIDHSTVENLSLLL
jgi:3-phenylpropionate/cinnamic acid dioxygenase small subunit